MNIEERIAMTAGCRDADAIPKVPDAGAISVHNGLRVQTMHNGLKMVADGYYGEWITRIISTLKGHHEPQEELIFHALLKQVRPGSCIVELGAYWAYYTCWYLQAVAESRAVCIEPNPDNLALGRHNAELNGMSDRINFKQAWIGWKQDGVCPAAANLETLECLDASAVLALAGGTIEMLHLDIQGAELDFLQSLCRQAARHIRFLVVSTHHKTISGSPTTHADCLQAIQALGGHILIEHGIEESFSGDGLIAASFLPADRLLKLPPISRNLPSQSLFPQDPIVVKPFVSYAQNFEDIMLHRALGHIGQGCYVDIGANSPVVDSVTKAFYERGWRGLNLEPVRVWHEQMAADRPGDINLQLAAADRTGTFRLYEVKETGLSTMSAEIAARHQANGFAVVAYDVPVDTVDAICARHGIHRIHFLKIDVEGAEESVLAGMGLTALRPWIILVEATEPGVPKATHESWDGLLTTRGYDFVYFDGLNRFYVAAEHAELKAAFQTPPNVFDQFVHAREIELQRRLAVAEAALASALAAQGLSIAVSTQVAGPVSGQSGGLWRCRCRVVNQFRPPATWLARRPLLRWVVGWLLSFSPQLHYRARRFAGMAVPPEMPPSLIGRAWQALRRRIMAVARPVAVWLGGCLWVRNLGKRVLAPFPLLRFRIKRLAGLGETLPGVPASLGPAVTPGVSNPLSARTQMVLAELTTARMNQQKAESHASTR